MGWIIRLTGRQLVHRPASWALLALGVAATSAIPVLAAATSQVVAAQTVHRTVADLPPGQRTITVIDQPSTTQPVAAADDAFIRTQLARLSGESVRRQLLFRALSLQGSSFYLAGTDHLDSVVRLTGGRLPTSCTPTRCEVVAVGAGDAGALTRAAVGIGVAVVGTATRTDATLTSGTFDVGPTPVLLAGDVDALFRLRALELFGRSYGWITPIDADRIVARGVPGYVALAGQVADAITARVEEVGVVNANDVLIAQDDRARLSARRFGLLGGTGAVLLLGFALVATIGVRREHRLLLGVLHRRGARRAELLRLSTLRAAACCVVGGLVGVALGLAISAGLAANAGLGVGAVLFHSLAGAGPAEALLLLGAVVVVVAALIWPDSARRSVWRLLDGVAAACAAVLVVSYQRGNTPASAAAVGADPLVIVLPVLAAVIGGLLAARVAMPLIAGFGRLASRSPGGRIAVLGALRRPLRPVATVGFVTAAVASVVFAGAYRSTLLASAGDQAAYQVPLDARLTTGTELVTPLQATSAAAIAARVPGARTYSVLRSTATVRSPDGSATGVSVLGIDPAVLTSVHRFSQGFGTARSAATVAAAIRAGPLPGGPVIPVGTHRLQLQVSGANADLEIGVAVATADGFETGFTLAGSGTALSGVVPPLSGPLTVRAITVGESPDYATHHAHAVGEGNTDQPVAAGTLRFQRARADGRDLDWTWSNFTSRLGTVTASSQALQLGFRLTGAAVVALAGPQPTRLAVAVDADTARSARDGRLNLVIDQRVVAADVVAVVARVPTTGGRVVLSDVSALRSVLDATTPPSGSVRELWVSAPSAHRSALAAALRDAPFDRLAVSERAEIENRIADDPVGRGGSFLLLLVAISALVATVVALILLVLGELGDGAGELFAWEADGVRPATLRRTIFTRAVAVVAVSLPAGLVTGLVLSAAATTLLAVDGSGVAPIPPLHTSIGAWWSVVVLAVAFLVAVVVVGAVSALALREPLPRRAPTWTGA